MRDARDDPMDEREPPALEPREGEGGEDPDAAPEDRDAPTVDLKISGDELDVRAAPAPVPLELRDVTFSASMRGYDRREVDAYVELVDCTIAELEVNRSPESAVKQALDRVGQQTAGILQQARESAEELLSTARTESEHATRRARVEATELLEDAHRRSQELLEDAQARSQELLERSTEESEDLLARSKERLGELDAEIQRMMDERERVLAQLRSIAAGLDAFAADAAGGVPADGEPPERDAGPPDAAASEDVDQPTEVIAAVSRGDSDDEQESTGARSSDEPRASILGRGRSSRIAQREASRTQRATRG